jgi:two-component system, chemotaxis family, sensor kinase CheA
MNYQQDKELLSELIVESREHLSEIEPDLLELEQKGDAISSDAELINRVFRAVHSIKGGFGFFGIEHITKLSHAMENVMAKIRDKNLAISPAVTDALLKGVDKLRTLLDDVSNAEFILIESEVQALTPFLDEKASAALAPKNTSDPSQGQKIDSIMRQKHPDVTDDVIVDAVKNGKLVYQITINSHADLADKDITPISLFDSWEKFGDILDVVFDLDTITGLAGSADKEISYSVVYSTVLEPDLVSAGTGIPEEQIYAVELAEVKEKLKGTTVVKKTAEGLQSASPPSGTEAARTPAAKQETRIEDALRVKVSLLNNLMNLAGELVLSRNQLMQTVNRRLSDGVDVSTLFKNVDQKLLQPCDSALDSGEKKSGCAENDHSQMLQAIAKSLSMRLVDVPGLNNILQNIDMVTSMLQESIMQTRLQPISVVFSKFPRLIRDLAKKLNKEINLTLVGQDVELDKSIVEQLSDPLTHLIRNSVDHGIESQEARAKAGKPAQGEVVLRAFHEGGKVHIQIQDDGAGINRERVRQKSLEKGLFAKEAIAAMSDREVDGIIMLPGFSTAAVVSDVSGRGVGMDVVKTNIERLGGTVDIESLPGKGTTITMKLPLTLAIISSLIVSAGGRRFAIPQVGIKELVRVRAKDVTKKIDRLKDCEVMRLRGKLLPLVRLENALGMSPSYVEPATEARKEDQRKRWSDRRNKNGGAIGQQGDEATKNDAPLQGLSSFEDYQGSQSVAVTGRGKDGERRGQGPDRRTSLSNAVKIIVLKYGERLFGLVVEDVFDSEEIVVKPLSGYLKFCQCYAGSTIMGDGSVAMILDTNGIAISSNLRFADLEKDIETEKEKFERESRKQHRELLLFRSGENGNFGLDLSMITRVEKVETSRIARVGQKEFLKYDDRSLRVIRLSDFMPVGERATSKSDTFVIVPKGVKHLMGIVADQVNDVVKIDDSLDTKNIRGSGIIGSAIINSALTMVIDVEAIFKAAEPELYS